MDDERGLQPIIQEQASADRAETDQVTELLQVIKSSAEKILDVVKLDKDQAINYRKNLLSEGKKTQINIEPVTANARFSFEQEMFVYINKLLLCIEGNIDQVAHADEESDTIVYKSGDNADQESVVALISALVTLDAFIDQKTFLDKKPRLSNLVNFVLARSAQANGTQAETESDEAKDVREHKYVEAMDRFHENVYKTIYSIYNDQIVLREMSVQTVINDLDNEIKRLENILKGLTSQQDKHKIITITHQADVLRNSRRIYSTVAGRQDKGDKPDSNDHLEIVQYIIFNSNKADLLALEENLVKLGDKADTIEKEYQLVDKDLHLKKDGDSIDLEQKKMYELLYSKFNAFILLHRILLEGHGKTAFSELLQHATKTPDVGNEVCDNIVENFAKNIRGGLKVDVVRTKRDIQPEFTSDSQYTNYSSNVINTIIKTLKEKLLNNKDTKDLKTFKEAFLKSIRIARPAFRKYVVATVDNALSDLWPTIEKVGEQSSKTTATIAQLIERLNNKNKGLQNDQNRLTEGLQIASKEAVNLREKIFGLEKHLAASIRESDRLSTESQDLVKILAIVRELKGDSILPDSKELIHSSGINTDEKERLVKLLEGLKALPKSDLLLKMEELARRQLKPFQDIIADVQHILDIKEGERTQDQKTTLLNAGKKYSIDMHTLELSMGEVLFKKVQRLYYDTFI